MFPYNLFSYVLIKGKDFPLQAQRVGRGIALLFHDCGTPRPHFTPRERPGTHCTGGWVGPRAGLDRQKISSPPGFDPGPSGL